MHRIIAYKLKATILEPMIALMIILFSLTALFLVVVKANRQTNIQQQVRACAEVDRVMFETIDLKKYLDETSDQEGIKIIKETKSYNDNPNLIIITVTAFDNKNHLLASRKRILAKDENIEK